MDNLQADGEAMIVMFQRYEQAHGHYPVSPAAAGVELPETRYGRWKYTTDNNGRTFYLSVGDYAGLDPFTLFWSSDKGRWSLDR